MPRRDVGLIDIENDYMSIFVMRRYWYEVYNICNIINEFPSLQKRFGLMDLVIAHLLTDPAINVQNKFVLELASTMQPWR